MPQPWLIKPPTSAPSHFVSLSHSYSTISLLEKPTASFACCAMFISAVLSDARKETPSQIAFL